MKVKKTIWLPLVLGTVCGLLAGISSVTGLSILTNGITENAIGFFVALFLIATALGGPLAGVIASTLWVIISAWFGPSDMKAVITVPETFWSNLIALGIFVALAGFAYRLIFERLEMPVRLLPWAGIVIGFYIFALPASLIPQYLLNNEPVADIFPAIVDIYQTYIPQVIFDIFFTSLVFLALPSRYIRPLWYEIEQTPKPVRTAVNGDERW